MKEFLKRMLSWFGPVETPPPARYEEVETKVTAESASMTPAVSKPKRNNRPKKQSKPKTDSKSKETAAPVPKTQPKKPNKNPATTNRPKKKRVSNTEIK